MSNVLNPWGDNTYDSRPIVWAYRDVTNQSLSGGAWNTIVFNNNSTLQGAAYNPTTGVVTVQKTGWYKVHAKVLLAGYPATNQGQLRILANSSGQTVDLRIHHITFDMLLSGDVLLFCGAGDTLSVQVYADAAASVRTGADVTCLQIVRVA
ncbi:hypothetical protein D3C75_921230 [compost metagenome]